MSKPRYKWWSYAKYMVRDYPVVKAEYDALHDQKVTQDYSQIRGSKTARRSTEDVAARCLPPAKQAEYDAVTEAIRKTKMLRTGAERLKLIDMVFWKQSHTLQGAGCALFVSEATAQRWHSDFIRLVGFSRGLADVDDDAE